ncbi:MAG TPA: FMN-binding protein [Flavobacteriaceae bacterium]|nr:FMN-binding protein [Flavobacteriaceae bacterium]
MISKSIVFFGFLLSFIYMGNPIQAQNTLQEKFHKEIISAFETEDYQLKEIKVSENLQDQMKVEMNNKNFFQIFTQDQLLGYAYLGEAASMKKMFDYVVFFDKDLIIKKSKVLIYREDFGRQIGTRRWLSQFDGMNSTSNPQYGEDIAAISGATISASSMTRAMNGVLKSLAVLQKNGVL